jgi:DNA-binding transcriptional LysR family regulator
VVPHVEVRHLRATIAIAEELNFTRAAHRLHLTESALSRQIAELEGEHGVRLFTRYKRRGVELTHAGRVFVEEARLALLHGERAVRLARATHESSERVLIIGHSPYADRTWISTILAMRRNLYPELRIRLTVQFSVELVRGLVAGELNLGLATAPPADSQITAVPFAPSPVCVVLPENHRAAHKEKVRFEDLADDEWIMFAKRFDPVVQEAILDAARRQGIACECRHEVVSSEHAIFLVAEQQGVAVLAGPCGCTFHPGGVRVKSLCEAALRLEAFLIMRADDDSRLVNQFARSLLRGFRPQPAPA